MLLAAVGIDGNGEKHPLGVIEGATENARAERSGGVQVGGIAPPWHAD